MRGLMRGLMRGRASLIACALVLLAYVVTAQALAGADFTQSLGQALHGHRAMAIAFAALLLLRLVAMLIVPPVIVATVGMSALARVQQWRRQRASSEGREHQT